MNELRKKWKFIVWFLCLIGALAGNRPGGAGGAGREPAVGAGRWWRDVDRSGRPADSHSGGGAE